MLPFINIPARIIGLLESNISSGEIAAGVCLGMFLGFTPMNGPMVFLLVVFFFIFRINRVSTLLTFPLFKAAYLFGLSGILEKIGGYLLIDARPLTGFWAVLTGLPIIAYLDINDTLVTGGLAASAVLSMPLYFIARQVTAVSKNVYAAKIKNIKAAKAVSGLKIAGKVDTAINTDSGISLDAAGIRRLIFGSIRARIARRKAPPTGLRKRVNIIGIAALVLALVGIQYGVGLAVSPMAGSLVIDTINRAAGTKISAESVNIWPLTISFSMKGLRVFDPKRPGAPIVKADEASFRVSLLAFLSKRLVFSAIILYRAQVDLEGSPDGSLNIQDLILPVKPAEVTGVPARPDLVSMLKPAVTRDGRDWFGKIYGFIKDRFSKSGQARRKTERKEKSGARKVDDLPKGRRVHFKSGPGSYLFQIKQLALKDAYIKIRPDNAQGIEIDKANVILGKLAFDPDNGASLGLFSIRGDVSRSGKKAGGLEVIFSQTEESVNFNIDLKDIDLDAVRFVYQDSLPVNVVKGIVTLSSNTSVKVGAINSRNSFSLTGHLLEPKDASKIAFGVVPESVIIDALNGIDPVSLRFSLGGTVERPVGPFQESLMGLVNPYISSAKDKLIKKGQKAIRDLIDKKLFGGS